MRTSLSDLAAVAGAAAIASSMACGSPATGAAVGKTVHHSTDFGWVPKQDVTEQFTKLLASGQLKPGEELVLDHTYRTRGGHKLPSNFILSAVKGAGFIIQGSGPTPEYGRVPWERAGADGTELKAADRRRWRSHDRAEPGGR